MHLRSIVRFVPTAALLAAVVFSAPAFAQRLSLAERVAKLEQDDQARSGGAGSVDLVNQINALQAQIQSLQGQNEELKHQIEELKSRSKDQYIDLDSRIGRLEGRTGAAPTGAAAAASNNNQLQDITLGSSAPPPSAAMNTPPPVAMATQAPPPAAVVADPADEKSAYDDAFSALKDGRYAESARRFQSFTEQYPNSELAPNAYYWLGESYYVTQNYPISLDTFQKLLARYPNGQKSPGALLKIGYCQYELKQWDQAEATLNMVVQKYPDTQEAHLAQGRLRALKLEGKR
jgi:tol-pal system protein YbgF